MSSDAALAFEPFTVPVLTETEHERAAMAAARSRGYAAGLRRRAPRGRGGAGALADPGRGCARRRERGGGRPRSRCWRPRCAGAAVELREATVPVLAEAETALVEAAFELAGAVVGRRAARTASTAARAAVERGGRRLRTAAPFRRSRLHPDDVAALRRTGYVGEELRLVADPALSPGDAIGELPNGWLDARIHEALERAKEALS